MLTSVTFLAIMLFLICELLESEVNNYTRPTEKKFIATFCVIIYKPPVSFRVLLFMLVIFSMEKTTLNFEICFVVDLSYNS